MRKLKKRMNKLDAEFPELKPNIKTLKAVCVERDSVVVNVTNWVNGEGCDIAYETKDGSGQLSINNDVIEYMVRAFIELKII